MTADTSFTMRRLADSAPPPVSDLATAGVAHEFNNVLAVVLASIDTALASPGLGPELRRTLEQARDACLRGKAVSGSLLQLFGGRQRAKSASVDIDEHLRLLAPMLDRVAGEAVRIDYRLAARGLCVQADPGGLDSVLLNLVANARNAMPHGGSILISSRGLVDAEHVGRGDARFVEVRVADEGHGMLPDVLERAFEPCFTTAMREGRQGTGLGLPLVREQMCCMGGEVRINSVPGHGTEVILLFQVAQASEILRSVASIVRDVGSATADGGRLVAASGRTPDAAQGDIPRAARVLVVEDDPVLRELVELVLAAEGYAVSAVSAAHQALELLVSTSFDLMLTDVVMPGEMDGTALAAIVSESWPQMRILLSTGGAEQPAFAENRWALLPKPYEPALLVCTVAQLLAADYVGRP